MATKSYRFGIVCLLAVLLCASGSGQTRLDSLTLKREGIWVCANGEVGLREPKGRNDHPRILDYHRSVSSWLYQHRPVAPYCASFVWYIYKAAGVKVTKVPNPARARDWFRVPSRYVMTQQTLRGNRRMMAMPQKGDVVGYYFQKGSHAISHIEILERVDLEAGYLYAIGANTSGSQAYNTVNRDGDGVYYVRRSIKSFYVIADVISKP